MFGCQDKLERQLAILEEQTEAVMVYGATELWHSWAGTGEDVARDSKQAIGVEANTLVRPPALLMLFLARKAITPCPSDVLVRRETVAAVGGFVDSFPGMYEDQVFFAKVTLQAPVFVSGECWSRHRQHPNSSYFCLAKNRRVLFCRTEHRLFRVDQDLFAFRRNKGSHDR